ncbi:MAG TPA: glutathionylspermidine synthase family protein [Polyangiaceae bacterium]|nr:glutathionylspermidine synthase family protein [Polyangiaceae bacterium]
MVGSHTASDEAFYEDWQLQGVSLAPFIDGSPRLRRTPRIISTQQRRALSRAAVHVCELYDELADIVASHPDLLSRYFGLTATQQALWLASAGGWHTIARADLFSTTEGRIVACELNSDTPSGMDEAWLLGSAVRGPYSNPNRNLRRDFLDAFPGPCDGSVGIVYPTDLPEDEGLLRLYRRWLEGSGRRVVSGAPANLGIDSGGFATLFGERIDVLLRHYKTDWWCERLPLCLDRPGPPDVRPLAREIGCLLRPLEAGKLAIVNPLGAIVSQNKLSLAFFHDHEHWFSPRARALIAQHLPRARRLSDCELAQVERDKDEWVLKSDYGCEGTDVLVGKDTSPGDWRDALGRVVPSRWIVQTYFEAERDRGELTNYGVFVVAGRASGIYLRASAGPTDPSARVVPVVERPPLGLPPPPGAVAADEHCSVPAKTLLDAYAPTGAWRPFLRLLVAYTEDAPRPFVPTEATTRAAEAGRTLAGELRDADAAWLVVCDLPGPESVAFGAAMAADAEVIVQIENLSHSREVVPLRETLAALAHFAPVVRAAKGPPSRPGPVASGVMRDGVIVLERRRLSIPRAPNTEFDNRHWAYPPSVAALQARDVRRIVYVHPPGEAEELDDLNEDFVQYELHDIPVLFLECGAPFLDRGRLASQKADFARHRVVRRRTQFAHWVGVDPGDA